MQRTQTGHSEGQHAGAWNEPGKDTLRAHRKRCGKEAGCWLVSGGTGDELSDSRVAVKKPELLAGE